MAVVTTTTDASVVASDLPVGRYVDWGPIIVGTLGALAIMVVLMTFGGALGLSVTSAQPYAGLSARALAVLAGLYAALVHVASFGAGGYVAGRLRRRGVGCTPPRRAHARGAVRLAAVLVAALSTPLHVRPARPGVDKMSARRKQRYVAGDCRGACHL